MPQIVTNYIELHICTRDKSGYKFLVLKRSAETKIYPGIWQTITGTIETHEHTKDTVLREMKEETGLTSKKIYSIPRINTFYFAASDKICMSPVFLTIVDSKDVKISKEHSEYKWLSYEEAVKLVHWPDQVESLKIINDYLNDEEMFSKLVEVLT